MTRWRSSLWAAPPVLIEAIRRDPTEAGVKITTFETEGTSTPDGLRSLYDSTFPKGTVVLLMERMNRD